MPEITADERGRRAYQIQKEKAVESAVDKIRLNLGRDWKLFSMSDIEILNYVLGEVWVALERQTWGRCAFYRLGKPEIDQILRIGKEVKKGTEPEEAAVTRVIEILKKTF